MIQSAHELQTRKVTLRRVVLGAFSLSWQHRASLFRATGMPLLAVIACTLASNVARFGQSEILGWSLFLLYGIATSWLAITVHRLVLLETSDAGTVSPQSLKRVALFLGFLIGMWLLFAALTLLIMSGVLNAFQLRYIPTGGERPESPVPIEWVNTLASALAFWVVARFSLLFPAIAIDRKPDLAAAWQASKRNGWDIAVVVGVLPWALHLLVDFFYRDGATVVEYAVVVVVTALFTVIEVVALSLTYWELTSPAPPPTDPPA